MSGPFSRIAPIFALILALTACTVSREIIHQTASIKDHRVFPSIPLPAASSPFRFHQGSTGKADHIVLTTEKGPFSLNQVLDETPTVALLIIRNDSILFEAYRDHYSETSLVNSFSMAKSYTSALVGIALHEGKIGSIQDSMTHYLTQLRGQGLQEVKITHLLEMTSGLHSGENYFNPFADVAQLYYGRNLARQLSRLHFDHSPGDTFHYQSQATQLLGMVVEKATGRSLADYFREKLWDPMGMETDANWSVDDRKHQVTKAFCCLNATARDFAKFGRLFLNEGNWQGQQLIPRDWVMASRAFNESDGSAWFYEKQWWLPSTNGDFWARGFLGQFIYVNPAKNLVIVRLGKRPGNLLSWKTGFLEMAAQL